MNTDFQDFDTNILVSNVMARYSESRISTGFRKGHSDIVSEKVSNPHHLGENATHPIRPSSGVSNYGF